MAWRAANWVGLNSLVLGVCGSAGRPQSPLLDRLDKNMVEFAQRRRCLVSACSDVNIDQRERPTADEDRHVRLFPPNSRCEEDCCSRGR